MSSQIDDIRSTTDFKGNTFSNFKKTEVKKQLENNLNQGRIEPSCYWAAEFICANQYNALWDILICFYFKHIHTGNVKACVYLKNRMASYTQIAKNGYKDIEIHMRNSQHIRILFCEVICVLCESKRGRTFTEVKINPENFDLSICVDKFRAPNTEYAIFFDAEKDPKDLFIALNEFSYNIAHNSEDNVMACYWMEWVVAYNATCVRNGIVNKCGNRHFAQVEYKHKSHIIWLLWHAIISESQMREQIVENIIQDCFFIYCFNFGTGCVAKRKSIIYFSISLLTEQFSTSEPIIGDKNKLSNIIENIDHIYTQIKQNEHSTQTEYLFEGMNDSGASSITNDLTDTLEKIQLVDRLERDAYINGMNC